MPNYMNRPHIGCGGNLEYEKMEIVNVTVNKRDVRVSGAKAIIKQISKNLYRCDKCNDLVNVVSCPSYEDFVMSGKIRVSPQEYWRIKESRRQGVARK